MSEFDNWFKVEEGEAGLWHASSPRLRGLHVTERSREEVLVQIPIVLAAMVESYEQAIASGELKRSRS